MPSPRPPMTKTVVKKVSSNVKVLRPGSKILTQTNTQKAAMIEKAKTKTPAAKASAAARAAREARAIKFDQRYNAREVIQNARMFAVQGLGYKAGSGNLTPAMVKAANKAQAAKEVEIKAAKQTAKASRSVVAARARGGSGIRGGLGVGGLRGNVNK